MNRYVRVVLVTTMALIGASAPATAMLTQPKKSPAKRVSCCEQVMLWLTSCLVDTETYSKHVRNRCHTVNGTIKAFEYKTAEKGAVVICNIDSIFSKSKTAFAMDDALIMLQPFFMKKGYTFVFVTTAPESCNAAIISDLDTKGYDKGSFTLCAMPTDRYNFMRKCGSEDKIKIIAAHLALVRDLCITDGHPIAASIDTELAYLDDKNAGFRIRVSPDQF